ARTLSAISAYNGSTGSATSQYQTDCVARDISKPLPCKIVFRLIEREEIAELAGNDIGQQPRSSKPPVVGRLPLGRGLDGRVVAVRLTGWADVLLAHMTDALETSGNILDLPALILADLLALDPTARSDPRSSDLNS
ncbi:MAG: hypothetical protein ACRD19_17340, partial [Terriglobia bacterium]